MLFSEYGKENLAELVERIYGADPPSGDDVETFWQLAAFPMLLEQIGVLHAERAISTRVVYRMWGAGIAAAWESWKDTIVRIRTLERRKGVYEAFEELAGTMRAEIEKREKPTSTASGRAAT